MAPTPLLHRDSDVILCAFLSQKALDNNAAFLSSSSRRVLSPWSWVLHLRGVGTANRVDISWQHGLELASSIGEVSNHCGAAHLRLWARNYDLGDNGGVALVVLGVAKNLSQMIGNHVDGCTAHPRTNLLSGGLQLTACKATECRTHLDRQPSFAAPA